MTWVEIGLVCTAVDVRRDNAVQVAPADDEAKCHASFIDSYVMFVSMSKSVGILRH